jgi:hypothetical protein
LSLSLSPAVPLTGANSCRRAALETHSGARIGSDRNRFRPEIVQHVPQVRQILPPRGTPGTPDRRVLAAQPPSKPPRLPSGRICRTLGRTCRTAAENDHVCRAPLWSTVAEPTEPLRATLIARPMKLTVKEAATLLSRSGRTVRAQLARGALECEKIAGTWMLDSANLPWTEAQRERTLDQVARAEALVKRALPKSARRALAEGGRSMRDFDPFEAAIVLLSETRAVPELSRIAEALEAGLVLLGYAAHEYDANARLMALRSTRERWCQTATFAWCLTLPRIESGTSGVSSEEPRKVELAVKIERELVSRLGGILRYAERQAGRGRAEASRCLDELRASPSVRRSPRLGPEAREAFDSRSDTHNRYPGLETELARAGRDLLVAIGVALIFPARRADALLTADEELLRLRLGLDLAGALQRLKARHVAACLDRAGRMVGGWRRTVRRESTQEVDPKVPSGAPTA